MWCDYCDMGSDECTCGMGYVHDYGVGPMREGVCDIRVGDYVRWGWGDTSYTGNVVEVLSPVEGQEHGTVRARTEEGGVWRIPLRKAYRVIEDHELVELSSLSEGNRVRVTYEGEIRYDESDDTFIFADVQTQAYEEYRPWLRARKFKIEVLRSQKPMIARGKRYRYKDRTWWAYGAYEEAAGLIDEEGMNLNLSVDEIDWDDLTELEEDS